MTEKEMKREERKKSIEEEREWLIKNGCEYDEPRDGCVPSLVVDEEKGTATISITVDTRQDLHRLFNMFYDNGMFAEYWTMAEGLAAFGKAAQAMKRWGKRDTSSFQR